VSDFRSTLNYSSVNEDWRTEARALAIGPGDRVLAITGGGRPLDLLLAGPERVVAIDAVPAQSALLELEAAAMRTLAYDGYAAFLGLTLATRAERRRVLDRLLAGSVPRRGPTGARTGRSWKGASSSKVAGALLPAGVDDGAPRPPREDPAALRFRGPRGAARLRERALGYRRLELAPRCVPLRVVLRSVLGDPAFHAHVAVRPGRFVRERMKESLLSVLARDNFMVSLTLRGQLAPATYRPGSRRRALPSSGNGWIAWRSSLAT